MPSTADPEPAVQVGSHCGPAGAGPELAATQLAPAWALASWVSTSPRQRKRSPAGRKTVTLEARWLDGRGVSSLHHARRQLRHDDELGAVALELAERRARRVHWERFTLTATGLVGAEEQLELFAPRRSHRLEDARDVLRQRFGIEVVAPMRQAV